MSRDQLTGVLNRSGFSGRFKELLSKAARYGTSLAVCYLDVDHFKKLNDTYGHALGDAVLQAAVAQAQGVLSQDTVMGRMGGDEFVIVLSGCAEDSGRDGESGGRSGSRAGHRARRPGGARDVDRRACCTCGRRTSRRR